MNSFLNVVFQSTDTCLYISPIPNIFCSLFNKFPGVWGEPPPLLSHSFPRRIWSNRWEIRPKRKVSLARPFSLALNTISFHQCYQIEQRCLPCFVKGERRGWSHDGLSRSQSHLAHNSCSVNSDTTLRPAVQLSSIYSHLKQFGLFVFLCLCDEDDDGKVVDDN